MSYRQYIEERVNKSLAKIEQLNRLFDTINSQERVIIYGAGEHSVKLLKYTNLLTKNIVGIVDRNFGYDFLGFEVMEPTKILDLTINVVVISSFSSQDDIYRYLKEGLNYTGRILKLYDANDKFPFYNVPINGSLEEVIYNPELFQKKLSWVLQDLELYKSKNPTESIPEDQIFLCLSDKIATTPINYYFYQDTWLARKIFENQPDEHIDIGSTVLLVGILSQFTKVISIDIRPLEVVLEGLTPLKGDILNLPFEDHSVNSISAMCVIEHIGLGRYGDTIVESGTEKAVQEFERVLRKNGDLYVSVPMDNKSYTQFNANRVFSPDKIKDLFSKFNIIDSQFICGKMVLPIKELLPEKFEQPVIGCFHFKKK